MSEARWQSAWRKAYRAYDETAAAGSPPRVAQIHDRHPWGTLTWTATRDGQGLAPARALVAPPGEPVVVAHRATAATAAGQVTVHGAPLLNVVGAAAGAVVGSLAAAYMGPLFPGVYVEAGTWMLATAGGGLAPSLLAAKWRNQCRTIDQERYARPLMLSAAISEYLVHAPSLSASAGARLRWLLWEAREEDPVAVEAELVALAREFDIPLPPPPPAPLPPRPEPVASTPPAPTETRIGAWGRAHSRHQIIKDAYGALIADPLNALEHSSLFDVGNHRTERFMLALSECDDHLEAAAGVVPDDRALVDGYVVAVRRLAILWDDARAYANQAGVGWLPEREQEAVLRAAAALRVGLDQAAAAGERQAAVRAAANALSTVPSLRLPPQALYALEGSTTDLGEDDHREPDSPDPSPRQ